MVDLENYRQRILEILRISDLSQISSRKIRHQLEQEYSLDLKPYKSELDQLVLECYDSVQEEAEEASNGSSPEVPISSHTITPTSNSASTKRSKGRVKSADVVDSDDELDGSDYKSTKNVKSGGKKRRRQEEDDEAMARRLQQEINGLRRSSKTASKNTSGKKKKTDGEKRPPNPNNPFMRPMVMSPALADFLNAQELPRPEIVKRLWAYIKEHNLQDPENKRSIICDERLASIFGKEKLDSFGMNKDLSSLLKKKEDVIS
ncbi:uncharacterized protein VTP21DRAFT_9244 [Calcarisporiella thermophila]|uniref:uncharacterized protein n=1 Tax=Calcarisporiella thermophila TaxID=911321 RepID=UPI003743D1E0